jgi:biotin carboxylase
VFVSQTYLGYASSQTLQRAADQARLSIVLDGDEALGPGLAPYISRVHRLNGKTLRTLRPCFDVDELTEVVGREIETAGGDPTAVALYCQSEDNVLPTAQVRRRTGIPGEEPEVVRLFRDKLAMKRVLARHLPWALPRYRTFSLDRACDDPAGYYEELVGTLGTEVLIVKPTDGAGSLNVAVVSGPADLARAAASIRTDTWEFEYEVDEFIHGTMHQCDSFVRDGKVVFSGILELGCSNFDFVKGKPLSVYPVTDEDTYRRLFDFNQKVITALGLRDGATHHEVFVARDGDRRPTLKFLEIAARVPGGLGVPYHVRNSGINLIDANILVALGHRNEIPFENRNNVVSALLPVGHGRIVSLNEPDVTSDYSIDWRVRVGDVVGRRSLVDNAGVLMLTNDDPVTLRRDFESLQSYVPVTCE